MHVLNELTVAVQFVIVVRLCRYNHMRSKQISTFQSVSCCCILVGVIVSAVKNEIGNLHSSIDEPGSLLSSSFGFSCSIVCQFAKILDWQWFFTIRSITI